MHPSIFYLILITFLVLLLFDIAIIFRANQREDAMKFDKNEHCKCRRPVTIPTIGFDEKPLFTDLQWIASGPERLISFCTGVVINPIHIVVPGHCLNDLRLGSWYNFYPRAAVSGSPIRRFDLDGEWKDYQLSFWTYVSSSDEKSETGLGKNNLGLIELLHPLEFHRKKVQPACIYDSDDKDLSYMMILTAGFGERGEFMHFNKSSEKQHYQAVKLRQKLRMTGVKQVLYKIWDQIVGYKNSSEFFFATPSSSFDFDEPAKSKNSTYFNTTDCLYASGPLMITSWISSEDGKVRVAGIYNGHLSCEQGSIATFTPANKILNNFGKYFGNNRCGPEDSSTDGFRITNVYYAFACALTLIELILLCLIIRLLFGDKEKSSDKTESDPSKANTKVEEITPKNLKAADQL